MRILLTGDSHIKDMLGYLRDMDPQNQYYQVWRGGAKLADIQKMISSQISKIQQFEPEIIVYHIGHNNINLDLRHNLSPDWGKDVIHELLALIIALKDLIPDSRHIISCIYPRAPSHYMTDAEAKSFNQAAYKLSRYSDTIVRRAYVAKCFGLEMCFVPELWLSVYGRQADPLYFDKGGLHLLPDGKRAVCKRWLTTARQLVMWYPNGFTQSQKVY